MEKVLYLPLKKEWFQMIKSGIKKEEYRKLGKFYSSRFLEKESYAEKSKDEKQLISWLCSQKKLQYRHYDYVEFTEGYPKKENKEKRIRFANPQFRLGGGKQDWGAVGDTQYFVISWGKQVL